AGVKYIDKIDGRRVGIADREIPTLVADFDPERSAVAAELAVPANLDAGRRERSAIAPDRRRHQRPGEIERVVHQVLADKPFAVAAVRHPVRILLALRTQQQAWRLDGIARQDI